MTWRDLEREVVEILREHKFSIVREHGETFWWLPPFDLPVTFNLTTFAKDLAKRLEQP